MRLRSYQFWLFAACTLTFSSAWAQSSDILLLVDDADPAAVTVTATTNDSTASDSSHTFSDGVDLADFFTGAVASGSEFPQTNLKPFLNSATPVYGGDESDNLDSPGASTGRDLQLFTPDTSNGELFAAGQQAFSGTATLQVFGAAISSLPAVGTMGDVYAGYSGDEKGIGIGITLIGAYEVVPEPGSGLLLLLAGVALLAGRQVRLACRPRTDVSL